MTSPTALMTTSSALAGLASVPCPASLTLLPGGTFGVELPFSPPPPLALETRNDREILTLLNYAGIPYRSPDSEAARQGIGVFGVARDFARRGPFERVSFDWDHTLGNYQIFEDVWGVIRTRASRTPPPEGRAETPMTALEIARPFMQELAFGMMVGYALRQGLTGFDQWERYEPKVGLVTHTWPDRIGILSNYFVRLLPLMEGLLPGSPRMYEKMTSDSARSIVHLHHFLRYAERLMTRLEKGGWAALSPQEQGEAQGYLADGKAHYRKPLGALAARGWETSSLLHFDDSTKAIADLNALPRSPGVMGSHALHVPHPHSRLFKDVQEWHKISLPALWRSRQEAALGVAARLARLEDRGSTIAPLLGALKVFLGEENQASGLPVRSRLPDGVVLMIHETPTTLGEFWRYYVEPTNRAKETIRRVQKAVGPITRHRK